ncbi:unnamed protein product [Clonostachys rosea]|uniref:Transcription factor domain-containing protein n=1 Tax=Bionectria ochroleuca TaxID=29856 RepID=A0ABY6U494_BIOOC|nr:unnamed protein product [Clonostachys rosea]
MGLSEPPRLHAFGYHLGIREEPKTTLQPLLTRLVTWEQARALVDIYTSVIHPVFGFLDTELLYQRSHSHWHGETQRIQYEALLSGVLALASFFSDQLSRDVEMRVALHCKSILEDPMVGIFPCLNLVSASILRTILITIHMMEAMGLHQDVRSISFVGDERPTDNVVGGVEIRERVAMVAQSLHILFAFDFGRSIVNLRSFSSRDLPQGAGDFTFQQTALTNVISKMLDEGESALDLRERLVVALSELTAVPTDHDFTTLTKAELCFAIYRRLRLLDPPMQETQIENFIHAGTAATAAARRLAAQKHPWWNTIHTIFQFVCVLLSIDSRQSIAEVTPAIETLQILNQQFSSRITQETLNMALSLVRACIENKRQDISLLEAVTGISEQEVVPDEAMANVDLDAFLQPMNDDIFEGLSDWL